MHKLLFIALPLAVFLLASCKENKTTDSTTASTAVDSTSATASVSKIVAKASDNNAEAAKLWLVKTITNYFNDPELSSLEGNMIKNTTPDYYAYKTDATNVDLDVEGSLTVEEFHKKWKDKFDTSKAGIGTGFLISGQDWSKIIVEKCDLLSAKENAFLFDVVLKDVEFNATYTSQILVTQTKGTYKIADVKE